MGIPGYFNRAIRASPQAILKKRPNISRLFLDFNSAIHRGVNETATDLSVTTFANTALKQILDATQPSSFFFLSIDGVAPLAKVQQQRSRRYMTHKMKSFMGSDPSSFDRCCITPGTAFMNGIDRTVEDECALQASTRKIDYMFSGSNQPGEGEHKIANYIRRTHDTKTDDSTVDCVYGLDADLIIICMVLYVQTGKAPVIVRENATSDAYEYLDVNTILRHIVQESALNMTVEEAIMNHVIASFLTGNDFLPPVGCNSVSSGSIDVICKLASKPVVTDGMKIDWAELGRLLQAHAKMEDTAFYRQDAKFWSSYAHDYGTCKVAMWDAYPRMHKHNKYRNIRPGRPDWRSRYYSILFDSQEIEGISSIYMQGLTWCLDYYTGCYVHHMPAWFYNFAYGPTCLDLANTIMARLPVGQCDDGLYQKPDYDYRADVALLLVTPPSSFSILDNDSRRLATDPENGLAHLFPTEFELHTYLKHWAHECRAIIPVPGLSDLENIHLRTDPDSPLANPSDPG